jgi:hypothetical protein
MKEHEFNKLKHENKLKLAELNKIRISKAIQEMAKPKHTDKGWVESESERLNRKKSQWDRMIEERRKLKTINTEQE